MDEIIQLDSIKAYNELYEYIQLMLLAEAKKQLLGTTFGISQIAERLVFQYTQHFVRMFKKRTGITPRDYRVSVYNAKRVGSHDGNLPFQL